MIFSVVRVQDTRVNETWAHGAGYIDETMLVSRWPKWIGDLLDRPRRFDLYIITKRLRRYVVARFLDSSTLNKWVTIITTTGVV